MTVFNHLDFIDVESTSFVAGSLQKHGCTLALIKCLAKNNNDKNQIYFHHDSSILNSVFDLTFEERAPSTSISKRSSSLGKSIPQAIFNEFYWLSINHSLEKAKQCKAITYHQYPETRLSGFKTENGEMPRSMTVDYTKSEGVLPRYLVLGATPSGGAVAMILVNPKERFVTEFNDLNGFHDSKICKHLPIVIETNTHSERLKNLLTSNVAGKSLKGCRFDKDGNTIPFTSTQVHGYTLEHACGIIPNANHDGDIYGIELKCFTSKKISLITTEADGGLYRISFSDFMKTYGYLKNEDYRLTGVHRAYEENKKTGLTLKIICYPIGRGKSDVERKLYDPSLAFAKQMNGMQLILEDTKENIAASWSIEHLMNRWGAKHNEVVYIPATVSDNDLPDEIKNGYLKRVTFSNEVLWCFRSTVKNLILAIHKGIIFLDPAPKFNESDSRGNKRRTQWRLNNIYQAAEFLYDKSEVVDLTVIPPENNCI